MASASKSAPAQSDATKVVMPCVDFPVRKSRTDPEYLTPIERALAAQGVQVASAPPKHVSAVAEAAPDVAGRAPTRLAAPPTGPARFAAKNRWTQSVVTVAFESGTSESMMRRVLEIASEWTNYTGVQFQRSSSSSANIRVGFQLRLGLPDSGHWSYVGPESLAQNLNGAKSMNLAITEATLDSRPYDRAVVLHEFGHAIGLVHEHQSPGSGGIRFDPGKTIAYFSRLCGWSPQMTTDNVLTRYNEHDLKMFSDFDRKSIMLYQYPGEITVDGRGTEQNYVLSDTDKEFTAKLYNVTPSPKTDGTSTQPPVGTGSSSQTLSLDGPRVSGAITTKISVNSFPFTIAANGTYTLATDGSTQVALT